MLSKTGARLSVHSSPMPILRITSAVERYRYFASMENTDATLRPYLRITYTVVPDVTPPVVSAVTATAITASGATINWTTNEGSDSQVDYGPTTSYGATTPLTASRVMSHAVNLTGLQLQYQVPPVSTPP